MQIILLIHTFATLFMVGLIWFVQIVHYPLFAAVGRETFSEYEQLHQRLTTWVVGPAMLVEFVTAVMLLNHAPAESNALVWTGVVLVALIWFATAALSVPAHNALATEYSTHAWQKLVSTNWIRTIAWTARGVLVLLVVYRVMIQEAAE